MGFLGQEGGADGGFFVGLEVVVYEAEDEGGLVGGVLDCAAIGLVRELDVI